VIISVISDDISIRSGDISENTLIVGSINEILYPKTKILKQNEHVCILLNIFTHDILFRFCKRYFKRSAGAVFVGFNFFVGSMAPAIIVF
jgi:hypothetical protein